MLPVSNRFLNLSLWCPVNHLLASIFQGYCGPSLLSPSWSTPEPLHRYPAPCPGPKDPSTLQLERSFLSKPSSHHDNPRLGTNTTILSRVYLPSHSSLLVYADFCLWALAQAVPFPCTVPPLKHPHSRLPPLNQPKASPSTNPLPLLASGDFLDPEQSGVHGSGATRFSSRGGCIAV